MNRMRHTQGKWPKSYPAPSGLSGRTSRSGGFGRSGRSRQRTRGARALAGTALACALLSPLTAASAAEAAPAPARVAAPVGSWQAKVLREGAAYDVTLSFGADRSVCLVSPAGASKGRWHPTGRDAFDYRIRELWYDANGALEGWVDIAQSAKRIGTSFAGSGVSTVYGADGTVETTVPVTVTGTRTGPPDGSACG